MLPSFSLSLALPIRETFIPSNRSVTVCGAAQRFPIVLSEFGSALNERTELDCFTSLTNYMTSTGLANDGRHAPIQSWFYWCAPKQATGPAVHIKVVQTWPKKASLTWCE
jgi:hypothetical protein